MAMADYRLCDVCGGKAFYDSNLNYGDADRPSYRIAGKEQYDDPAINEKYGATLDYVGDWAVICTNCSDKYETKIVERAAQQSKGDSKP